MNYSFFSEFDKEHKYRYSKMGSESEEEENHSATSPRSRREQIQEVMESYKEKLMNIKGQVEVKYLFMGHALFEIYLLGFPHDGQPKPDVPAAYRHRRADCLESQDFVNTKLSQPRFHRLSPKACSRGWNRGAQEGLGGWNRGQGSDESQSKEEVEEGRHGGPGEEN